MPRACSQPSKRRSTDGHLPFSSVFAFWVNTEDGRIATYDQLDEAGLVEDEKPLAPWHPIQGPSDASTMWYTVLRRQVKGVYIGTLCFRHGPRQASLEDAGWQEVPIDQIGP
jgi:hypothetical protein